jgi:5-methylcytosine-specific restriction protein A
MANNRSRSKNLKDKPVARDWIEQHEKDQAALLIKSIRRLEEIYEKDYSGFINSAPPQYRFNDQAGEYVILTARSNGSVLARIQNSPKEWMHQELNNESDIERLIQLISEHEFQSFNPLQDKMDLIDFDKKVDAALKDTESDRLARLKAANPVPQKTWRKVASYIRNPDVVAEALFRAKGKCQACPTDANEAPFLKRSDGQPYLEVHHEKPLSEGGNDTIENAIALCPNCHRKKHFG